MVPAPAPRADAALPERITDLVRALRGASVPVAVSDGIDAVRAAGAVDLLDREQLRAALAATTIKNPAHRAAFDTLFDIYFPRRPGAGDPDDDPDRDIGAFLSELVEAVLAADDAAVDALAREAVGAFGGVQDRDGATSWFTHRVFRQISTNGLLRRLLMAADADGDNLADRLTRDDFEARLRRFRAGVEAEARRRLAAQRGPELIARTLLRTLPEDTDFFRIGPEEEAAMRRAVRPLARRLASRLALERRRATDGRLDARRTMRAALSTGGVPIDPVFRARHPHRPEIVALCDVSGSVSAFARFSLLFTHALQGQVSRVRSFAFIDAVDEVTELFSQGDPTEAFRRLASDARLVRLDGHSDYGHALSAMLERYGDAITPRTTLLVLGDARNNYRAAHASALAELRRRAKRVYWLNPEPKATWDSGDSILRTYAVHTDATVECRNLRQLAAFIETVA